jgi:hypothetical protein
MEKLREGKNVKFYVFMTTPVGSESKRYILSTQHDFAKTLADRLGFSNPKLDSPESGVFISNLVMQHAYGQPITLDTVALQLPKKDFGGGIVRYSGQDGYWIQMAHEGGKDMNADQDSRVFITPDVALALQSPTSRRVYNLPDLVPISGEKPAHHQGRCCYQRGR